MSMGVGKTPGWARVTCNCCMWTRCSHRWGTDMKSVLGRRLHARMQPRFTPQCALMTGDQYGGRSPSRKATFFVAWMDFSARASNPSARLTCVCGLTKAARPTRGCGDSAAGGCCEAGLARLLPRCAAQWGPAPARQSRLKV